MKTYPSDEKFVFLLADDFRQEVGGKLTILGLYPGSGINVEQNLTSVTLQSLSNILIFQDGHGIFSVKIQMIDPDDNILLESDYGQISKDKDVNMVIVARVAPFKVPRMGRFKSVLFLDGRRYERLFPITATLVLSG
jgi:hypothetical protein